MTNRFTAEQIQNIAKAISINEFRQNAKKAVERTVKNFDVDKYYNDIMESLPIGEVYYEDMERSVERLLESYIESNLLDYAEECWDQIADAAYNLGYISKDDYLNDIESDAVSQVLSNKPIYEWILELGEDEISLPNFDEIWSLYVEYSNPNWR